MTNIATVTMIGNLFDFENDSDQKATILTVIEIWITEFISYG
jgi:hypothetical protein